MKILKCKRRNDVGAGELRGGRERVERQTEASPHIPGPSPLSTGGEGSRKRATGGPFKVLEVDLHQIFADDGVGEDGAGGVDADGIEVIALRVDVHEDQA